MIAIMLAALISSLMLMVEHWFPWQLMLRRELGRLWSYVLGVLALMLPITGLLVYWELFEPGGWVRVVGVWVVVLAGGLSVVVSYGVDWVLHRIAIAKDLSEIERMRNENRTVIS